MSREDIINYMSQRLDTYRMRHCLGVEAESIRLAKRFGCYAGKAAMAGLMHDCAKWMSDDEYIQRSKDYGIKIDAVMLDNPSLLHGSAAAHVMKHDFGITDQEVLDAVCYHCIPRADMEPLDMVISVADLIEPNRDFDGVAEIREIAGKDLIEAYIATKANVMRHVANRKAMMHPSMIYAYNKAIMDLKSKK